MNKVDYIFKRIIDASKNNTLSFFVGAGVSKVSKAPKWSELIDAFCEELKIAKKGYYSNDDYLSIPQKYYYSINKNDKEYYTFINNCFDCSSLEPNDIHQLMCYLNPKSFITTNFDDLLEKAVIQHCLSFKSVACDSDVPTIHGDRYILKLHGDLVHKNIVLKEEDYLNYSENFKLIETLLKSVFSTNTVVFIGYGLNDYNIKLILNWAKNLLKDSFNKPIFIYTDDAILDDNDLLYQQSRGLEVIDFKLLSNSDNFKAIQYSERYKIVLKKIISYSEISFTNKDKHEAFEFLYKLVKPLDAFITLRVSDISNALKKYLYIREDGVIILREESHEIMTFYIELKNKKADATTPNIQTMFNTIDSVFAKARIRWVLDKDDKVLVTLNHTKFADNNCITFNYLKMENIVAKNPKNMYSKYIKAFYLAKLKRYDESFKLFTELAIQSYKNKNYVLCYFSQINRHNIAIAMKGVNHSLFYYNLFDFDEQQQFEIEQGLKEKIFENLPIEFKDEYEPFSDLYTVNFLYKNVYNTLVDNEKLRDTINKHTFEAGVTSADKAIYRINDNLHFILGNGLFLDEFAEFKVTIKNTMELIVAKYSVNNQKIISNEFPVKFGNNSIEFDEIDIFCFIEFFKDKEITNLMVENGIIEFPINNIDVVDASIHNLFAYYDIILSKSEKNFEVLLYQCKMKNCLKLLRYISISPKTITYICSVLLKYEFREIYINDKILFIDSQISAHKIEPQNLQSYIHKTLIKYIDENVNCIERGEKFNIPCTSTGMEYWDLANYLTFNNCKYISKHISDRIDYIIENKLDIPLTSIFKCRNIIYIKCQKKLTKYMYESLETSFDFEIFSDLLTTNIQLNSHIIIKLKEYLKATVERAQKGNNGVYSFPYHDPYHDPYEDLINVGYWCTLGNLKHKDFCEFVGIVDKFDFYFAPDEFDYSKFNVAWLINLNKKTYETIFKSEKSKEQIRISLKNILKDTKLEDNERRQLTKILIEYAI